MSMSQNTIKLQEIFLSVQGEGYDSGLPTIFVRLFGCNLIEPGHSSGCRYCDVVQNIKDKKKYTVEDLVRIIRQFGIPRVCFTGGEPLIQWDSLSMVVLELVTFGFDVSIETNGCTPIEPDKYARSFKYVMDVKCPSSRMSHRNILDNLKLLQPHDEVKFVVANEKDYEYMKKIMGSYPISAKVLVSPCFVREIDESYGNYCASGRTIVGWLLRDKLSQVRLSLQQHKILGVP